MKITKKQIEKLLKESIDPENLLNSAKKAIVNYNYQEVPDEDLQLEINDAVVNIVNYLVAKSKIDKKDKASST